MPCSCQINRVKANASSSGSVDVQDFPHEVLPGESCIYCAQKHMSIAYALSVMDTSPYAIIGELELARRHTAVDYPDVASEISAILYSLLTEGSYSPAKDIVSCMASINSIADCTDPYTRSDNGTMQLSDEPASNALVGYVHLCAAYRLAFEVGYMEPNRSMIIGDLALARENLARLTYDSNKVTRDLRHRIQNRSAADLSSEWIEACRHVYETIKEHRADIVAECSSGLKEYLGLSAAGFEVAQS